MMSFSHEEINYTVIFSISNFMKIPSLPGSEKKKSKKIKPKGPKQNKGKSTVKMGKKKGKGKNVEDSQCPICNGYWSQSMPGEDWVQCSHCKKWLHEACCGCVTATTVVCDICYDTDN